LAFTSPKTWASGYVVLASDLNTYIRDNQNMTAPAIMTSQGDLLIASGANTPIRLAKSTTSTQYLANTGTSNAPAWNEVALSTGVSGTLPVGNGGTGATTLTANGALVGNGTSAIASVDMSTKGGLLAGDGSGNPSVLAIGGTADHVLTVDSGETTGMKWAAAGAPGTSFEGSQTTEATTNSETPTDLLTIASISIGVSEPFVFFGAARKTTGAGGDFTVGLKVNSTVVGEAINNDYQENTKTSIWSSANPSSVNNGAFIVNAGPQATNYLRNMVGSFTAYRTANGTEIQNFNRPCQTAAMPAATITSLILRGDHADGTNTGGLDEFFCYAKATS